MSRRSCGGPPGSLRSAPRTASPTSPTGCRRCSPPPATPMHSGYPATASTCSRCCAGKLIRAGPATVLAVVPLRADAVRQRGDARRHVEAALPRRARGLRHPRRRPGGGAAAVGGPDELPTPRRQARPSPPIDWSSRRPSCSTSRSIRGSGLDLAAREPDRVGRMDGQLGRLVRRGRARSGPRSGI